MATYRLFVECDYCGEIHPLPFAFSRDAIYPGIERVTNIFIDNKIPDDIYSILTSQVYCPETAEYFVQENNQKIFMTPV
jgi:hypothetical protein